MTDQELAVSELCGVVQHACRALSHLRGEPHFFDCFCVGGSHLEDEHGVYQQEVVEWIDSLIREAAPDVV